MLDNIKAKIHSGIGSVVEGVMDYRQNTKPITTKIGAELLATAIPTTRLMDKDRREELVSTVGDFGVGIGQEISKSFMAIGAEIHSTLVDPLGRPQIGKATFTPAEEWEQRFFGTKEPISIENIGNNILLMGGEEFAKKWGATAIPVGFLIAGLDTTPIGFGKKALVEQSAKVIAKTQNITQIRGALKPMFPEASDAVINGLARSLRNIKDESAITKILQQVGSIDTKIDPTKKARLIKPEADMEVFQLANFIQDFTIQKSSAIAKLEAELRAIRGARMSGKIDTRQANLMAAEIKEEILKAGQREGIALRITKGGEVKLSKKASGSFVSEDFARYPHFQDAHPGMLGGTKDITRYIQEADGALSVKQRTALPGQAGRLEQDVLWRTRDLIKLRASWLGSQEQVLLKMTDKISPKKAAIANRVLVKINQLDAKKTAKELLKDEKISSITKDESIVEFARQSRQWLDKTLETQNYFRRLRGQEEIPRRVYYSPEQIKQQSLWSEALGTFKNEKVVTHRLLPDYIKPEKPFIGHDLARQANLPEYLKEMNLKQLLEKYANAAGRDIFNSTIVQNNKAHIQQLDAMGLNNVARALEGWTARAFVGIQAPSVQSIAPPIRKAMKAWRENLNRAVFPLNISWNLGVQSLSSVFTVSKYGVRNSTKAMFDWFARPSERKWVADNAYSYIIKTGGGRVGVSRQDVSNAMANSVRINKKKLETVQDMANFFTEGVEKHITGWSVLAAKRNGARRGLKDKALIEYASDGGAKTQSMYNMEDMPGLLASEISKTVAPFQTFTFEGMNNLREFAGRAGVSPDTIAERTAMVLRFIASMTAANAIAYSITGREPWQLPQSFIPYGSILYEPIQARLTGDFFGTASTRQLPSPVGISAEFADGFRRYMTKGDTRKLRQVSTRYLPGLFGIPGGTQINRMVDGMIAISEGGVKDSSGKMIFPIYEPKDKIISLFSGPWATEGGKEYLKERETSIWDLLNVKEPEKSIPGTRTDGKITPI